MWDGSSNSPSFIDFWHPFCQRLWRTGMLLLTKLKGLKSNVRYSRYPNHLQSKSSLHISILQSKLKHKCLPLDTLQLQSTINFRKNCQEICEEIISNICVWQHCLKHTPSRQRDKSSKRTRQTAAVQISIRQHIAGKIHATTAKQICIIQCDIIVQQVHSFCLLLSALNYYFVIKYVVVMILPT